MTSTKSHPKVFTVRSAYLREHYPTGALAFQLTNERSRDSIEFNLVDSLTTPIGHKQALQRPWQLVSLAAELSLQLSGLQNLQRHAAMTRSCGACPRLPPNMSQCRRMPRTCERRHEIISAASRPPLSIPPTNIRVQRTTCTVTELG